ncbi:oligosaccharide flippase family protein [Aliivibrio fischeri]|uniref:oligosaccharide flippase family protein n=1 Tax=Aliivibrio fischeri TaxID=668 RepID=UPI00147AF7A7|nr:oligosaccharide flippase family protein [Aliivibrio fischeri]
MAFSLKSVNEVKLKVYITVFNRFLTTNIIQLVQFFIIAKYFSIVDNGKISILLTSSFLISQILLFGIPSSIVYFGSKNNILSVMKIVFKHISLLLLLLFTSLTVIIPTLDDNYYYSSIAILSFTNVLYFISQSFFQMKENFRIQNIIMILQTLSTFFAVSLYVIVDFKTDYILFIVIFNIIASIFSMYLVLKDVLNIHEDNLVNCERVSFYKYSFGIYLNSLLSVINGRLDVLIIGAILGNYFAGLYSFIVQISERMAIFSQVITTVLFPKFSKENNINKVLSSSIKSLIFTFCITFIAYFIFLYLIPYLNDVLFSSKYNPAIPYVKYGLLAVLFNSTARVIYMTFSSLGLIKLNFKIGVLISLITLLLFPFFCYTYGLSGAVISLMLTSVISLSISFFILIKCKKNNSYEK